MSHDSLNHLSETVNVTAPKTQSVPLTRRELVTTGVAAIGFPLVLPRRVWGANERIVYGHIGVGGMGRSHVVADSCAALCDVDQNHLVDVAKRVQGTPLLTDDYRRVLDRKDIDAVTIGTPDHWHALMTVHACQAGKDVYSEKPTCKTIAEGQAMVQAAKRYKRVVQIGAQGRSNPVVAKACEYVRNGQIGTVKTVEIWHPNNYIGDGWGTEGNAPSHLNYDMWLGPLAWRPYNDKNIHFNFRWLMDSGGGFIRDRGNHALSVVLWLLGQDGYNGPVTVEATGEQNPNSLYDVPLSFRAKWTFTKATGGVTPTWTLLWEQPGKANPRFPGEWGATYTGDKGDLIVTGGDGGADTEQKAKDYKAPSGGFVPYLEPGEVDPTERHRRNWRRCIQTREKPVMDVETGYKVIALPIIANIAYQVGRPLTWNPQTGKFVNDKEADRFLSEPYRRPWRLDKFEAPQTVPTQSTNTKGAV